MSVNVKEYYKITFFGGAFVNIWSEKQYDKLHPRNKYGTTTIITESEMYDMVTFWQELSCQGGT